MFKEFNKGISRRSVNRLENDFDRKEQLSLDTALMRTFMNLKCSPPLAGLRTSMINLHLTQRTITSIQASLQVAQYGIESRTVLCYLLEQIPFATIRSCTHDSR